MKLLDSKWKIPAIVLVASLSVVGCGSTTDSIIDDIATDRQANISFVNGVDQMATFYAKTKVFNRSVFDERQRARSVVQGESGDFTFKWIDSGSQESEFGVKGTVTNTQSTRVDISIDNNSSNWMIAWLDGSNYKLTGFKKNEFNTTGRFEIRVFANADLAIRLNQENNIVGNTTKGEVSASFIIDNCATGLNVGGNSIEFCNVAEFGKSYIAVVNSSGKIVVLDES